MIFLLMSLMSDCHAWKVYYLCLSLLLNVVSHSQDIFLWSRNSSTVKEIFLDQGIFLQSRNFSTKKFYLIKKLFHDRGSFPQSSKFSTQKIYLMRKFSTIKKIFHEINFYKQRSFPQKCFLWWRKFSANKDFYTFKKRSKRFFFCKLR